MSLFDEIRNALEEAGLIIGLNAAADPPATACAVVECKKGCKDCILHGCKTEGCQSGGCRVRVNVGDIQAEPGGPDEN